VAVLARQILRWRLPRVVRDFLHVCVCGLQGACVMNTLDSVVDALARDPGRKFVVAEQVTCSPKFPTGLPSSFHSHTLVIWRAKCMV
jgi:hypothetical protein